MNISAEMNSGILSFSHLSRIHGEGEKSKNQVSLDCHSEVVKQSAKPVLVLFGPPGSGKGTFSQFAKDRYNYIHLSVGDLVRDEIDLQTTMGKEADECLKKGEMLLESTIQALVLKHIIPLAQQKKKFILDGFPRTEEAVEFIRKVFENYDLNDKVLLILTKSSDNACVDRILSRTLCKECGTVYNLKTQKPKEEGICDHCHTGLKERSNDTKEIVKKRLEEYHQTTEKAYEIAKTYFPSLEFDTDSPIEDCLKRYIPFFDAS